MDATTAGPGPGRPQNPQGRLAGCRIAEGLGALVKHASDPLSAEQVEQYWEIVRGLQARMQLLQLEWERVSKQAAKEGPDSKSSKHKHMLMDVFDRCCVDRNSPLMAQYPINIASLRVVSFVYDTLNRASAPGTAGASAPVTAGASPNVVPRPVRSASLAGRVPCTALESRRTTEQEFVGLGTGASGSGCAEHASGGVSDVRDGEGGEAGAQGYMRAQPEHRRGQLGRGVGGGEGWADPFGHFAAGGVRQGVGSAVEDRAGKRQRLAGSNAEVADGANNGFLSSGEARPVPNEAMDEQEQEVRVEASMLRAVLRRTEWASGQAQAKATAAQARAAAADARASKAEAKVTKVQARAAGAEAREQAKAVKAQAKVTAAEARTAVLEGQLQAAEARAAEAEAKTAADKAALATLAGQLQAERARAAAAEARFQRVRALMSSLAQQAGITRRGAPLELSL